MKKSELKNIIKECVKEVIFEEGVLSGIITEVAQGLQGSSLVQESRQPQQNSKPSPQAREAKKKVLSAIGNNGYDDIKSKFANPQLFEGTQPIPESGKGPLGGMAPGDAGVDITNIPGMGNWSTVVSKIRK
jgi:ribosomal protein S20